MIYIFAKRFCRYFLIGQVDGVSAWSNTISPEPNTMCNYNTHLITEWVY